MDIFLFELRYRAYQGLCRQFGLSWSEEEILSYVKLSGGGLLTKKLDQLTPQELQEITIDTYTDVKKQLIESAYAHSLGEFSLADYIIRLEYESKVIQEMGFVTYFLIVQDFINRAKCNTIMVGPGRGSAAGSLLAWLIGITDVDPLPFGLLFERFLNPARISMPDIDIDFEDTQRDRVLDYVKQKYGHAQFCHIGTYMKMAAKAAFKDVARVLGVQFDRSNQISNLLPEKLKLGEVVKSLQENKSDIPELVYLYESDQTIKQALDYASQLEGIVRQIGVHACGVIISPDSIVKYTPVQYPLKPLGESQQEVVSQYNGKYLENIGLLKMDFLGLRNLSVIKNCIKIIVAKARKEKKEIEPMFDNFLKTMSFTPPLDDQLAYEKVLQTADTSGVFQFESDGMRNYLAQLKPTDINDIVAMGALYRPGPMEFIPSYIRRKHGEEEIIYMLPELKEILLQHYDQSVVDEEARKLTEDLAPILGVTYGIAVYQEQLMFLVQRMAGFSFAEADILRRGIGKKIKEVIEKIKKEFEEKAGSYRGYKPETAIFIYEKMIEPAAFYSFNKSHSVSYGLISYQTAYLKAHYPIEFNASLLRSVEDDTDKLSKFIDEIKMNGLNVLPPDINRSFNHVAAVDEGVLLGFYCIKGVGFEIGEMIEQQRKAGGNFVSLDDFLTRCSTIISKKSLESLIKSGALDQFGNRYELLMNIDSMLERAKYSPSSGDSLFGAVMKPQFTLRPYPHCGLMQTLMYEYDAFKTFVGSHPFDGMYAYLKKFTFISNIKGNAAVGAVRILAFIKHIQRAKKKGFFITLEDISDSMEVFVNDSMDLKDFDIVIVEGYKTKNFRLSKMIVCDLDVLRAEAKKVGKFDPEDTVARVKYQRLGVQKKLIQLEQKVDDDLTNYYDSLGDDDTVSDGTDHGSTSIYEHVTGEMVQQPLHIVLPEDVRLLEQLRDIIKDCPGDHEIQLGTKHIFLTRAGIERIKTLLSIS